MDAPSAKPLALIEGAIQLNDVTFGFDEARPVLKEFSLSIAAKRRLRSWAPLARVNRRLHALLLRLYDPSKGAVIIDGQNVREVTQESLRQAISYVPQESVLFHRSLKENIAYGKPGATDEEIIEAAKRAHCHDFISTLPQGYDTLVGERGIKLSGGERQRVAIARAILKDAPILVLDEATSSLDSESEAHIQAALAELMQGKTVIAIAHRLSTIMKMDRIIVMEGGKATLSGTHNELVSEEGNLYKKLWDIQAGGFIRASD
jgi:ATP-binding cassette subfamily B protein